MQTINKLKAEEGRFKSKVDFLGGLGGLLLLFKAMFVMIQG